MRAQAPRDEAQLDRPESLLPVHAQGAELHERRPQAVALGAARGVRRLGAGPLTAQQGHEGLAEPGLLVAELEVHSYS